MVDLRRGDMSPPSVIPVSAGAPRFGEWLATVRFRPAEGEDRLRVIQRYGPTPHDAVREVLSAVEDVRGGSVSTLTVDGAHSRQYIAAAGHLHELQDALKALDLADGSSDDDVQRFLRAHAVTLHGRTFGSNVRQDSTEFISFDETDFELRNRLRLLRNRNVAHSENTMTVTFPMVSLQNSRTNVGSVQVEQVWAMTIESGMPTAFVKEFRSFLHRTIADLVTKLGDIRSRVKAEATEDQLVKLYYQPKQAKFDQSPVNDWTPNSRRAPFPDDTSVAHYGVSGEDVKYTVHIDM